MGTKERQKRIINCKKKTLNCTKSKLENKRGEKKVSALQSVRFIAVRFIEDILSEFDQKKNPYLRKVSVL